MNVKIYIPTVYHSKVGDYSLHAAPVGNFQMRKLLQISRKWAFHGENFVEYNTNHTSECGTLKFHGENIRRWLSNCEIGESFSLKASRHRIWRCQHVHVHIQTLSVPWVCVESSFVAPERLAPCRAPWTWSYLRMEGDDGRKHALNRTSVQTAGMRRDWEPAQTETYETLRQTIKQHHSCVPCLRVYINIYRCITIHF